MKRMISGVAVILLALSSSRVFSAADVKTDGAVPGQWTMDLAAAEKLAADKKLPILLNFSGSDWCGWCQLMEKNVFSDKIWKDYARSNLVMVVLDFPKDKKAVPEKYVKRNAELKDKYRVEGFPTFIMLDDDGQTVLGKLGAGEDKTPESFISELRMFFRYRAADVAQYTAALNPKDKETYLKIVGKMIDIRKGLKDQEQQIVSAQKKMEELQKQGLEVEEEAMLFRAGQLGPDKLKECKDLKAKLEQATQKLQDWLKTEPKRNQENADRYKAMGAEIQGIVEKLRKY